jgi:serine protease Do
MKKPWVQMLLFAVFSFVIVLSVRCAEIDEKVLPIPLSESEGVLAPWLKEAGFTLSRTALPMGEVELVAHRGKADIHVLLQPRSPLATSIRLERERGGANGEKLKRDLWQHLDNYIRSLGSISGQQYEKGSNKLPVQAESVVCIVVTNPLRKEQFTGFVIDKKGLIVATAHGLENAQDIVVMTSQGGEYKGSLIKADYARDLALLRIQTEMASFISLTAAKNNIRPDETLYAIGCSSQNKTIVHSGKIFDAPRRVNGIPLWQVNMEIQPGSSGSPVFNAAGELTAVVKGRFRGTDTIGFLIPFPVLSDFLTALKPYELRSLSDH